MAPPALGTPAPRRPAMRPATQSFPCSRLLFPGRPGSYGRCAAPSPAVASATPHAAPCAIPVRWELYRPSRRSSRPTSPGCVAALCLLQNDSGELAPLRLGHDWLRPWGPRRDAPRPPGPERPSLAVIAFCGHWYSPPPPYSNPRGPVSVRLAERAGREARTALSWNFRHDSRVHLIAHLPSLMYCSALPR